jgi:hypothetical protein
MQHRLASLTIKVGLPVLIGQFLSDWISNGLLSAAGHLPLRAILIFAVLLMWAAFREYRERKNQTFR